VNNYSTSLSAESHTNRKIIFTFFDSSIGRIFIAATSKGICMLAIAGNINNFIKELEMSYPFSDIYRDDDLLKGVVKALKRYLKGIPTIFKFKLDVHGTLFQEKVWNAILKVPFGKTISYKDVASMINMPMSVRAVGNACGKNPVPIIIPCHRVVASDGGIGGYSSRLAIKKRLLKIEKICMKAV